MQIEYIKFYILSLRLTRKIKKFLLDILKAKEMFYHIFSTYLISYKAAYLTLMHIDKLSIATEISPALPVLSSRKLSSLLDNKSIRGAPSERLKHVPRREGERVERVGCPWVPLVACGKCKCSLICSTRFEAFRLPCRSQRRRRSSSSSSMSAIWCTCCSSAAAAATTRRDCNSIQEKNVRCCCCCCCCGIVVCFCCCLCCLFFLAKIQNKCPKNMKTGLKSDVGQRSNCIKNGLTI